MAYRDGLMCTRSEGDRHNLESHKRESSLAFRLFPLLNSGQPRSVEASPFPGLRLHSYSCGGFVFERYYRELLSFLSRKVADRATAADLVQESYARVYGARNAGDPIHEPRALLYRTARNLVIDQGRRRDVRARYAEPQEDVVSDETRDTLGPSAFEPDRALETQQMVNAILTTIDQLPLRCREAFILHKFDGLTHAQVAQRMGVSVKMVEQHVRNAVEACRRCRQAVHNDVLPAAAPLRKRTTTRRDRR